MLKSNCMLLYVYKSYLNENTVEVEISWMADYIVPLEYSLMSKTEEDVSTIECG